MEMKRKASKAFGGLFKNLVNSVNPPFPSLSFRR
jgi:hypothetical protein